MSGTINSYFHDKVEQAKQSLNFRKEAISRYRIPNIPGIAIQVPNNQQYTFSPYEYRTMLEQQTQKVPITGTVRQGFSFYRRKTIDDCVAEYTRNFNLRNYAKHLEFIQNNNTIGAFKAGLFDWAKTMSDKGWVKLGKIFIR